MTNATVADVQANLNDYIEQVSNDGPVAITQNGKIVAVLIVPRDENELEQVMLVHSPRFQSTLEQSRRSIAAGHGLSESEFWQQVDGE